MIEDYGPLLAVPAGLFADEESGLVGLEQKIRQAMQLGYERAQQDWQMGLAKARVGGQIGLGRAFQDLSNADLGRFIRPDLPRYFNPAETTFTGSVRGTFLPRSDVRNMTPGAFQQIARRDLAERLAVATTSVPTEMVVPALGFGLAAGAAGGGPFGILAGLVAAFGVDALVNTDMAREHFARSNFIGQSSGRYIRPGRSRALDGSGFSHEEAGQLSEFIAAMGRSDRFFKQEEIDDLTQGFTFAGQFDAVRSVSAFREQFKQSRDNLKLIMQEMGSSIEEGLAVMQSLSSVGIQGSQVGPMVQRFRAVGNQVGITQPRALATAIQRGAQLFHGTGVDMDLGVEMAAYNMETVGRLESFGALRPQALLQLGGAMGASERMGQVQSMLLRSTSVDRAVRAAWGGGGTLDNDILAQAVRGDLSGAELGRMAVANTRGTDLLRFRGQKAELLSTLDAGTMMALSNLPLLDLMRRLKQVRPGVEITPDHLKGLAMRELGWDPNTAELAVTQLFNNDPQAIQQTYTQEMASAQHRAALGRQAELFRALDPDTYLRAIGHAWDQTVSIPIGRWGMDLSNWYEEYLGEMTGVHRVEQFAALPDEAYRALAQYEALGQGLIDSGGVEDLFGADMLTEVGADTPLERGQTLLKASSDTAPSYIVGTPQAVERVAAANALRGHLAMPATPAPLGVAPERMDTLSNQLMTRRDRAARQQRDPAATTFRFLLELAEDDERFKTHTAAGRQRTQALLQAAGLTEDQVDTLASTDFGGILPVGLGSAVSEGTSIRAEGWPLPDPFVERLAEADPVRPRSAEPLDLRRQGSSFLFDDPQEIIVELIESGQIDTEAAGVRWVSQDELDQMRDQGNIMIVQETLAGAARGRAMDHRIQIMDRAAYEQATQASARLGQAVHRSLTETEDFDARIEAAPTEAAALIHAFLSDDLATERKAWRAAPSPDTAAPLIAAMEEARGPEAAATLEQYLATPKGEQALGEAHRGRKEQRVAQEQVSQQIAEARREEHILASRVANQVALQATPELMEMLEQPLFGYDRDNLPATDEMIKHLMLSAGEEVLGAAATGLTADAEGWDVRARFQELPDHVQESLIRGGEAVAERVEAGDLFRQTMQNVEVFPGAHRLPYNVEEAHEQFAEAFKKVIMEGGEGAVGYRSGHAVVHAADTLRELLPWVSRDQRTEGLIAQEDLPGTAWYKQAWHLVTGDTSGVASKDTFDEIMQLAFLEEKLARGGLDAEQERALQEQKSTLLTSGAFTQAQLSTLGDVPSETWVSLATDPEALRTYRNYQVMAAGVSVPQGTPTAHAVLAGALVDATVSTEELENIADTMPMTAKDREPLADTEGAERTQLLQEMTTKLIHRIPGTGLAPGVDLSKLFQAGQTDPAIAQQVMGAIGVNLADAGEAGTPSSFSSHTPTLEATETMEKIREAMAGHLALSMQIAQAIAKITGSELNTSFHIGTGP